MQPTLENTSPAQGYPFGEVFLMFLACMAVLYIVQLTGKINLGLYLPGINMPLRKSHREFLQKYIKFYRHLDASEKRRFERLVRKFIVTKNFVPRQMPRVTAEMKVCLAATAVQITFGLSNGMLQYFTNILVYPDDYFSTINKQYHKGEVNPKLKAVVVSWKSFLLGVQNPEDGRNLGLHEMAHAFHIENSFKKNTSASFETIVWANWQQITDQELAKMADGEQHFFRAYAAIDSHEFFAVAIENFFEKPVAFRSFLPDVYLGLQKLLNLDPATLYTQSRNY
jgi:Mlc titration factor MtfA (ptsG expression regulator)